ncbi:acyl-CoA dehydrogenase [Cohnella silvisoli]|uniref:Acyl-CoA dehydrogenase n=1 Tax=Cohnella silvisoli TaxID=2873699 RepID=A0ABV1KMC6_9BACL|nr:acyl-CoA dehydrogenase [Cohnella silvisoli]MCD9020445.1 acyl-CoA dehydrogenase [Cohnella silvisoli]
MPIIPEKIVYEVRANADNNETAGTLTTRILDYMYEAKLFKLFVPSDLGGLMLPFPEALRVFERASQIDGSFGWLVTIGSGGGFFSAALPPEQSRLLFGNDNSVVAGSGHPNGIARSVDGGYIVSGQWKYCSGSTYASLFTANCRIEGEPGEEAIIRSFAFMPEQVSIIRDWNSFGLKGTDSHSISVEQTFVPTERTFDIMSNPHYDDPIFRYPFLPFAQTSFAAVCLGVCRHFLEEARSFAIARQADWTQSRPQRIATLFKAIEEQEISFEAVSLKFYEVVERSWADFTSGGRISEQDELEVGQCSQDVAKVSLACAHAIFPLLGMAVLMEDNLINRIWRDLHTVTQHSVLVPN